VMPSGRPKKSMVLFNHTPNEESEKEISFRYPFLSLSPLGLMRCYTAPNARRK
jgi:hypothetical protein